MDVHPEAEVCGDWPLALALLFLAPVVAARATLKSKPRREKIAPLPDYDEDEEFLLLEFL